MILEAKLASSSFTNPTRWRTSEKTSRARYVFHPEYSARQALSVDSKAERVAGARTITIQTSQTSLRIRQIRGGHAIDEQGTLPKILRIQDTEYLVTTVFVKYNYNESEDSSEKMLESISVSCLPNGFLQERYNPTPERTIWLAGRNAPSRGKAFRVRISLPRLKSIASWRVQHVSMAADAALSWDE